MTFGALEYGDVFHMPGEKPLYVKTVNSTSKAYDSLGCICMEDNTVTNIPSEQRVDFCYNIRDLLYRLF